VQVEKSPLVQTREKRNYSGRVVVLEDEPSVRTLTVKLLENAGYRVNAFAGPDQAIQFFVTSQGMLIC
jgi:CheY-like chemotaxis protein